MSVKTVLTTRTQMMTSKKPINAPFELSPFVISTILTVAKLTSNTLITSRLRIGLFFLFFGLFYGKIK